MNLLEVKNINFKKLGSLVPAIIQNNSTLEVLMVGFMNADALKATIRTGKVTFYSRTKKRLWQKGETSGNTLEVKSITPDCDNDSLLIMADPMGPTCHTGAISCFNTTNETQDIIYELEKVIIDRKNNSIEESYTSSLFKLGECRIAQKVSEEATETIIASLKESKDRVISETADLIYHLIVLLQNRNILWNDILVELKKRRR